MSTLKKLNKISLELRKSRDDLAKSISVVVSTANQIAKDRATDKNNFTVTDDDAIQAIRRAVKQVEDTISVLNDNNATDGSLGVRSYRELSILKDLLPQAPTETELSRFVQDFLVYSHTAPTIKAMGPIMKSLGEQYGSALDRTVASRLVKTILGATT